MCQIKTQLDARLPAPALNPGRKGAFVTSNHDLICTHDFDGRILSVNVAACEAMGLSASVLRGMTIQQLLPAANASGFAGYLQTLQREGFAEGTMKLITRDGVVRIWEYRNTLDVDNTSLPIVHGVARDVTEREEAFLVLRRSEELFRSIIENASDMIAIVELDGRVRYTSPSVERVLGYPCDGIIGKTLLELIHPDDALEAAVFVTSQVAGDGKTGRIELRVRHQTGTWRSLEFVANNLVTKGQISAIVVNARDITERKFLEAQLVQANRLGALGRLAATVAHEFNNVLMGMQPFSELLQRTDATPAMVSKGAWHIANSIQRGKRIVMDMLGFTQPRVPVTAAVDVGEWWGRFAPEAEGLLGNLISVVSNVPRHGLYAVADRAQLSQVLVNLVTNARDAMPQGGTLTVTANELAPDASFSFGSVPHPETFVQISVRDTGQGMASDVRDRIFEPLYTTRKSGGTGLGLAIAHQVMAQHGGFVFVESEPGEGSAFHLFVPKAPPPPSADLVAASAPLGAPAARRLLIIDDEPSIVAGISALLGVEGIEIEAIGSGFEAAETVARFHPDIVLLDFGLPGMDGSEVYTVLRAMDRSLPIIFATGHGDRRILHDRLNDPRTRFLQKPFEVSDLLKLMVELERSGVTP